MSLSLTKSQAQHDRARMSLARGIATAFRAAQEPVPVSFARSAAARMTDVDGNEYVDFALLWRTPAPRRHREAALAGRREAHLAAETHSRGCADRLSGCAGLGDRADPAFGTRESM
jgi:4-aminobutyrate aminotransferase-like enzyme